MRNTRFAHPATANFFNAPLSGLVTMIFSMPEKFPLLGGI